MQDKLSSQYIQAVDTIKNAILKSQLESVRKVSQEQLSLYYGIGRFISVNTRNKNFSVGAVEIISEQLRHDMPGIKGFSATNLKNMRTFYEQWISLEKISSDASDDIRPLKLTDLESFPVSEFLSISFSNHITILSRVKTYEQRIFYIKYAHDNNLSNTALEKAIDQDLFSHAGSIPNNFLNTIPDYRQAVRAIRSFKDQYILDFINVEQVDVFDPEDIDERVIENSIMQNVKNFIMTFGKAFAFVGNQVHYEKFSEDNWIDLLFYNRELKCLVAVELKKGDFKPSYLGQLNAYLRILDAEERREGENPSIGIILCKKANKPYIEFLLGGYNNPMGVATYKLVEQKLKDVLPNEDDLKKLL